MIRLPACLLAALLLGACRSSVVELRGEVSVDAGEYPGRPLPSGTFWIELTDRQGRRRWQEVEFQECRWEARVPRDRYAKFLSMQCEGRSVRLEQMARVDVREAGQRESIVLEVVPTRRVHRPGEFCAMPLAQDIIHPLPSFARWEHVALPTSADSGPAHDQR